MVQLVPNKIYVTPGGIVVTEEGKEEPWGYDRVQFIEIKDGCIVIKTPWNSTCVLPPDYTLYETDETVLYSEFPLRGRYISCKEYSFEDALSRGICKKYCKIESVPEPQHIIDNDVLIPQVISTFATPCAIAAVATSFGVKYQKIRYILKQLIAKGYNSQQFEIRKVKRDGVTFVQLLKVFKNE